MGNHKITWHRLEGGIAKHAAVCRCGWRSSKQTVLQVVEDEVLKHGEEVERLRAWLGTRTPSLKAQYDYYKEKAEDPSESESARALWKQLAQELSVRLNINAPQWDQPPLFSD